MSTNVFSLQANSNKTLQDYYDQAFAELNDFFELGWQYDLPKMYILEDRTAIDQWHSQQGTTMNGWPYGTHQFYVISEENYPAERGALYEEGDYYRLIKHEMSHCFFQVITNGQSRPIWLWEGVAVYVSGQHLHIAKPKEFKMFLNSKDSHQQGVFEEAGHAIALLVERHGRQHLVNLLKELNEHTIEGAFQSVYQTGPSYDFFNSLLK